MRAFTSLHLLSLVASSWGFVQQPSSFVRSKNLSESAVSEPAADASTDDFDLKAYFMEKLPDVEKALDQSIVSKQDQTEKICEAMRYSLLAGGKRIRPILCLASAEMFLDSKEELWDKVMPTAVGIEMIHTMSLIHDDLPSMDNDDLRRGKPTNHVVYGEETAILAGDALLSESFQHVTERTKNVDPSKVVTAIMNMGKAVGPVGLAGGQLMDLTCEGKPADDVTIEDLRWIHVHKTAVLLKLAVVNGALLAGAEADELKALEEFANYIGLAFQVADDILDVTQSTEELGKTAGKDEDTDKATFPRLLGLEGSRKEAERLTALAKESLVPFGDRAKPLLAIADFIINRSN